MGYRNGLFTGFLCAVLITASFTAGWFLTLPKSPTQKAHGQIPAAVAKTLKEEQINTVVLTSEAIDRLALRITAVESKPMRRVRVYGGEVIIPTGKSIIVSAPLSGIIKAPASGVPTPGQAVTKGQPILQLLPMLTPEGRVSVASAKIEAEGQVRTVQAALDAAQIALDRATRVFQSDAGSKRAVDEAQAQVDLAKKSLEAATARKSLLDKVAGEVAQGTAAPLTIEAPDNGLLRNLSVQPGQNVPSGAALFELVNLDQVWVRVPIYVGDLPTVNTSVDAQIADLTAKFGERQRTAKPAIAPPMANAAAGTVDRFYEIDNRRSRFSPGQRVAVKVPLNDETESLVVPWSAIVHDIYGGTWAYEQIADDTFARRRVEIRFVDGDVAVMSKGPPRGTKIVAAGAMELFGAESGFSK